MVMIVMMDAFFCTEVIDVTATLAARLVITQLPLVLVSLTLFTAFSLTNHRLIAIFLFLYYDI